MKIKIRQRDGGRGRGIAENERKKKKGEATAASLEGIVCVCERACAYVYTRGGRKGGGEKREHWERRPA